MVRRNLAIILFLFNLVQVIYPQFSLVSETINGNKHILYFSNDYRFYLDKTTSQNKLLFQTPFDESKSEQFNLPESDIFIPIPIDSKPRTKFFIEKEELIPATPEVNPTFTINNQKEIQYKYTTSTPKSYNSKFLIERGYFFYEGNKYLHLSFSPFIYNPNEGGTIRIIKFRLEINYTENVEATIVSEERLNSITPSKISYTNIKSQRNVFSENDTTDKWIDYNSSYVKIGVNTDAVYRITYADLIPYINLSTFNPKSLRLLNRGKELPIYVSGEEDNSFDQSDFIEFVGVRNMGGKHREINKQGEPYNEYLDRYSDTTIYWLTWGGGNGLRVQIGDNEYTTEVSDTLEFYDEIIHYEKNNWFDFSMADQVRREMPYWFENKTWHEGNLGVGTKNSNFTVSDVYPDKPLYVFSKLQSYASNITANAHLLAISLNTSALQDSGYIDKYNQKLLKGVYNSNLLKNGTNTLKIHSFATQAFPNTCIFDWYEVEYPRWLKSFNDSLLFSFPFIESYPTVKNIKISNVSSDSIIIWKFGGSIKKYNLLRNGDKVTFNDTLNNKDKYILIKENKILSPKIYYAKQFSNLRNKNIQADYLAITHKKFISKTNEYTSFISDYYSVKTKIIDVDDIYDEFSFGYFNPEAIKDFLKSTHSYWQYPYPEFVCLIGGATYDYLANKTKYMSTPPKYNYVPSFGASVSDNWFVTWDTTGAYLPQMNIGRVPVTTEKELEHYMDKHKNYVNDNYDAWNKRFIFFSGGTGNNQSQLDQLREVNNYIIDNYVSNPPVGGNSKHFYKTINPNTNFGPYTDEEIKKSIDEGSVFISYLGHSGTQTWDNSITTPSQLSNKVNRHPLITDFGCSTARFAEPDVISFSQLFVTGDEGDAIAYIGNSSLGFLSTSLLAPKLFYEKVLKDSVYTISEALKLAKVKMLELYGTSGVSQLFALTSSLIGDPIVKLQLPRQPNLSVSSNDIRIVSLNPSDIMDSLSVFFSYFNYGKVTSDSFYIVVEDSIKNSEKYVYSTKKLLPNFSDSLSLKIPIRKKTGEHILSIHLDTENSVKEISESDNIAEIKFYVVGSNVKSFFLSSFENGAGDLLEFINPVNKQAIDSLEIELSTKDDFDNPMVLFRAMDTLYTSINISSLENNRRYWMRFKVNGNDVWGSSVSFTKNGSKSFLLSDSISYLNSVLSNLKFIGGGLEFDTTLSAFSVLSAGYNDGNSAVIRKNSKNYIPENTLRGHHICLFDATNFDFIAYKHFDLLGGGTTEINNYINFLDTLSNKYLVIIAVSDVGNISSSNLKNQLKTLGSIYIDSLVFRGSWAIIGRKGAIPGSVPEAFTKPFNGKVEIDTIVYSPNKNGSLLTSEIGPVGKWDSLLVKQISNPQLISSYYPIGIKTNGTMDTLNVLMINNGSADLSLINAKTYPKIRIQSKYKADSDSISPGLSYLSVRYHTLPELATNYQVASASKDSLVQGDSSKINFYIYNVGETPADSFNVKLLLVKPDNSQRQLFDSLVVRLDSMSRKYFTYNYHSNSYDGYGKMTFRISIDDSNKILELYEDNNVYDIPVYVAKDTTSTSVTSATLDVTYDGIDIIDGDYVAPDPEINMTLSYPVWFPVNDSASVQIYLDGEKVNYSNLKIFSDTINRKLILTYLPSLTDGEHRLRVYGQNIIGSIENNPGYEKIFNVSNEMNLLDVFNYPNPFKDNTSFTFKLSQIPDEFKIKIYTVAGRLIKEFVRSSSELKYDFNQIPWDGRDEDGNLIANGVYLYRIQVKKGDKQLVQTQKLAIVR
ncbi:MAG: T9SS C-terminal target domain-containing protein [Ignavibacteriales bacterium]|nr:MAG: T9SS C-terminal target domain-containing protein [Ignavibacteriales bacterium]